MAASDEAERGGPRRWHLAPAIVLVVVALWEIFATRHAATSVPDDEAWAMSAQVLRGQYQPGDLIVFAPDWVDPVGRLHLGDLIPVDVAARMDAARFGLIYEVSIRGARSPDTAGLMPNQVIKVHGIEIRKYERTPVEVLADLRDRISTATVLKGGRGPSLELAEVGFAPHRCIQVVPTPDIPMQVTFPGVPVGTQLVGYVGIADVFTRRDNRAAAQLEVQIAGRVIARARAGVDDGWVRFEGTTTPGTADITVVARSAGANRLICFAAELRR